MIYDTLDNLPQYFSLHPDIEKAYDFLLHAAKRHNGRHELSEAGMFANVEAYTTQSPCAKRAEAHRRYIDVQFVVSGEELLGFEPLCNTQADEAFDAEHDIGFYRFTNPMWLTIRRNCFCILFPHEAHMPGTILGSAMPVQKIVVKLPVREEKASVKQ